MKIAKTETKVVNFDGETAMVVDYTEYEVQKGDIERLAAYVQELNEQIEKINLDLQKANAQLEKYQKIWDNATNPQ